jgi:hypothetical protein
VTFACTMRKPPRTQAEFDDNLAVQALFVSGSIASAIRATIVLRAADDFFYTYAEEEQPRVFRTNPANTVPYAALRALEESTVVHIVETLKYAQKLKPTNARLRGLGTLELLSPPVPLGPISAGIAGARVRPSPMLLTASGRPFRREVRAL